MHCDPVVVLHQELEDVYRRGQDQVFQKGGEENELMGWGGVSRSGLHS